MTAVRHPVLALVHAWLILDFFGDSRRRGSQGAVMTARIRLALELGCRALFTETGESVGGDPQHSYRNIARYGFAESVLRENWAPPKA